MDNTNAERQERWRQRQKAKHDAVAAELEQVKARIAELEGAASSMTRLGDSSTQRARIQIGDVERKAFARLLKPNPTIADLEQAEYRMRLITQKIPDWLPHRDYYRRARSERPR